jgi:hypothetical protein
MNKKILICGDSFGVTDPDYPGLHWSEKILNFSSNYEIINLSTGGCSNALITLQLLQGLKLNPDFVILSFTAPGRYEYDNNKSAIPTDITGDGIAHYIKKRYTSNTFESNKEKNKITVQWVDGCSSDNMEHLKNYFMILFCLMTLKIEKIPFCFSLGGFEYSQDYALFLKNNYIKNSILEYQECEIFTNLWAHVDHNTRPYFHVADPAVQTLYANECIKHIEKTNQ